MMSMETIISESVRSGIKGSPLYERKPFAVRVCWIEWDSGFRDSGLQIEDLIVAVDDKTLLLPDDKMERQRYVPKLIGEYSEYTGFADQHKRDGDTIALTVLRKKRFAVGYETHQITGTLRAERVYYDQQQRRALGPGGPDNMVRDNFNESWLGWYGKRIWDWERYLDGRWLQRMNNRQELQSHQQWREQVEFAFTHYTGPFAQRLKEDFDAVARCLQGREAVLAEDAFAFRQAAERNQGTIAKLGDDSWREFISTHQSDILTSIPRIDLIRGDRSQLTGKWVVLERLSMRQMIRDGDRYLYFADHSGYWCFIANDWPSLHDYAHTLARYKTKVVPRVAEQFNLVGRITEQTRLVMTARETVVGFNIDPIAIHVPGHFFALLNDNDYGFAGESALADLSCPAPAADASACDVMRTLIAAVKAGDSELWRTLFADWVASNSDSQPYYRPFAAYNNWDSDWTRARNIMLNKVVHIEPSWQSDVRTIMTGQEFDGAPHIEEVTVELDHINRFDDGDWVFSSIEVNRVWQLQRRNHGPWRIASRNTL